MFTVNGRAMSDFIWLADGATCRHSNDDLVGYVVRKTVHNSEILWNDRARTDCGHDVAVLAGENRFAEALDLAAVFRGSGEYAIINKLFACGCRA